jgi:AraC-like DNA-binding protein/tetratricopeptide (TPR) repeat protein
MPVPGDVKQALELLRARPERHFSIAEIAACCGVAPRTLQKHFKTFVGKTPGELRFEARMDWARRELLRAKTDVSVAAIATSCGINHLGRFASLYRRRFGETPSATLRRRRLAVGHSRSGPIIVSARLDRPVVAIHGFCSAASAPELSGFDLRAEISACLLWDRWLAVGTPENARYHLRGNVCHHGASLRVTAMLTSGETGRCLWADRWQGLLGNLFELQDRIVTRVTTAIRRALLKAEIDRAAAKSPEQAGGWELSMMALPNAMRIDGPALAYALELAERAMEQAPADGLPVALAAWCRAQRGGHHFATQPAVEKRIALELVARGADLISDDPVIQALFGGACALSGRLDEASRHIDRSLALDGGNAWGWNRLGMLDVYRGNFADATEAFQIARDLDPLHPLNFMCSIGIGSTHFDAGRYAEGAHWFDRAIAEHPAAIWVNRFRAPALLLAGKKDDAKGSFANLNRRHPDLSIRSLRQAIPYTQEHWDRLAEGLVDLGMPLQ